MTKRLHSWQSALLAVATPRRESNNQSLQLQPYFLLEHGKWQRNDLNASIISAFDKYST